MYDVVIIGCGVSGASCAYMLSKFDLKVAVLERSSDVASGTTKANSAIIHAGFDPKPGTQMAQLNVRGVELAKEICEKLEHQAKHLRRDLQCALDAGLLTVDDSDVGCAVYRYVAPSDPLVELLVSLAR